MPLVVKDMKVLTFISSLSLKGGGPSRSVPMLVKGLANIGVDITLMVYWSDDMNSHALDGTSAKLKILQSDFTKRQMEEYILFEKFDIIQIQSIWEIKYHYVAKIARKHNIPYIVTPRGMLEPWSLTQSRWKKKLALALYQMKDLKHASCIFTTAEKEAQHVRKLGIDAPISVIPNGIETDAYPCRTSINGVKKQILFLSRIHIKKGIELLIDTFDRLISETDEFKSWKVIIVGNGEYEYIESLKKRITSLNLENNVKILEPVFGKSKIKLYQESSIFCLPSYSENFGMVIAEAMSCGVPCITTNGTPWQILNGNVSTMGADLKVLGEDRKTGWCIDLNIKNLEIALREAMTMDFEKLYEMGRRGHILVNEYFNYKSVAKKTKTLFEWLVIEGKSKEDKPNFVYTNE